MPKEVVGGTSQLTVLLLLLSFTTGLVDAITVLGLGKVFTANMTGNVVFLGFAVAGVSGSQVAPYVFAIVSFLAGAVAAGRFALLHSADQRRPWLLHAAMVEAALLWAAAGNSFSFNVANQQPTSSLFAMISVTGLAMGFRNGTIRRLNVADLTTTVLTMTLTGLAADSAVAGGANTNWGRRVLAVVAIFLGAVAGALFVSVWGLAVPLILAGALGLVGTAACAHASSAA